MSENNTPVIIHAVQKSGVESTSSVEFGKSAKGDITWTCKIYHSDPEIALSVAMTISKGCENHAKELKEE